MVETHLDFDAGKAFIERSRDYVKNSYVPRVRRALDRLSEPDLWWRPNPGSNSVANLLLHLSGNARQWIVSGVGGAADVRRRAEEFAAEGGLSKAEVLALFEQTMQEVDDVLAGLDLSTLDQVRRIQGRDVTVLDAIYHVVEHVSMHTGQILFIAKMRSGEDLGLWRVGADGCAFPTW
jgi:uncharacterized damage-inducible protein DinB